MLVVCEVLMPGEIGETAGVVLGDVEEELEDGRMMMANVDIDVTVTSGVVGLALVEVV